MENEDFSFQLSEKIESNDYEQPLIGFIDIANEYITFLLPCHFAILNFNLEFARDLLDLNLISVIKIFLKCTIMHNYQEFKRNGKDK